MCHLPSRGRGKGNRNGAWERAAGAKLAARAPKWWGRSGKRGGAKQHRGEPQALEEMGKGQCTPRFNSKAGFAVGTGEPGEPK